MTKITENEIEELAIELLKKQGFEYHYEPDISPDSENPLRVNYSEVVLDDILHKSIEKLNSHLSPALQEEALKKVKQIHSDNLINSNETFHQMLTEGINITYQKNSEERGNYVKLIDFKNIKNNM